MQNRFNVQPDSKVVHVDVLFMNKIHISNVLIALVALIFNPHMLFNV